MNAPDTYVKRFDRSGIHKVPDLSNFPPEIAEPDLRGAVFPRTPGFADQNEDNC
jgi:hypothetical protein